MIKYSGRNQDLHTKKESLNKALIRSSSFFLKTFSLKKKGFRVLKK